MLNTLDVSSEICSDTRRGLRRYVLFSSRWRHRKENEEARY
jgi:hypothetical protein